VALKIFYTYTDINDPFTKYPTTNDYTAILNDAPDSPYLGEIAAYDKILAEAKLMDYDIIGMAQKRRQLVLPTFTKTDHVVVDPNKIYHTSYWVNGTNNGLWKNSHPQAADLFDKACEFIINKWPEYYTAVNFVWQGNILFPHNLFVMSRDKFERYSQWLQVVLRSLPLPPEPSKVGSLLAERLFTIWVFQNFPFKDQVVVRCCAYDKKTGNLLDDVHGVVD
jgi:hypothetical protein